MMGQTTSDTVAKVEAHMLDSNSIILHWPNIQLLLEKIPHTWSYDTPESMLQRAAEGHLQVWLIGDKEKKDLVIFTQIAVYPARRVLEVIWCVGADALEHSKDAVNAALDHFAREQDCAEIAVIGRMGWERILRPWGFKRTAVVMSRPVVDRSVQ